MKLTVAPKQLRLNHWLGVNLDVDPRLEGESDMSSGAGELVFGEHRHLVGTLACLAV